MNINRSHIRIAAFATAIALLLQSAPVMAERDQDRNRPVEVTFTKWVTGPVFVPDTFGITEGRGLMKGLTGASSINPMATPPPRLRNLRARS